MSGCAVGAFAHEYPQLGACCVRCGHNSVNPESHVSEEAGR